MEVYLVQHAEAKSEQEDPERGLTEKGLNDMEKVASFAGKAGLRANKILHSGKKRARETAEVLARHLKLGISEEKGLYPLDDPEAWRRKLSQMEEPVVIVGHLPHLSRLSSLLLSGDKEKKIVDFRMGGLVALRKTGETWSLAWMITPELL